MAEKPVVHDSATSFAWGIPALLLGIVLWIASAGDAGTNPLRIIAVFVVLLGVMWLVQGTVRSARNRDAMTRALLEHRGDRDD